MLGWESFGDAEKPILLALIPIDAGTKMGPMCAREGKELKIYSVATVG